MFKIPKKSKMKRIHGNVSMSNCFLINMSKKKKNKNKQKWLTDKLKGEWMDKDSIIEIALFNSLIHYVEKEDGLNDSCYDFSEELQKGHVRQDTVDAIKLRQKELNDVYLYLKNERPALKKQVDEWDGTNINEFVALEDSLLNKDTELMNTIVKYRGYMWT
jgi:hypothetical protein